MLSLQKLCLWKQWPAAHQIRAPGARTELKGDGKTDKDGGTQGKKDSNTKGTYKKQGREVHLMQMWSEITLQISLKNAPFISVSLTLYSLSSAPLYLVPSLSKFLSQTPAKVESPVTLIPLLPLIWFLPSVLPLRLSSFLISSYRSGLPDWECWHAHGTALNQIYMYVTLPTHNITHTLSYFYSSQAAQSISVPLVFGVYFTYLLFSVWSDRCRVENNSLWLLLYCH